MQHIRFHSCVIKFMALLFAACTDEISLPEPGVWTPKLHDGDDVETLDINVKGVVFQMNRVAKGVFKMGSEEGNPDERPVHSVTISHDYYIGETEVTQALWQTVMGSNPSDHQGDNLPVENVSWTDCQRFIEKLNQLTGRQFRLPSEAEWEFAARGGSGSHGYVYSGSNEIDDVAWYDKGIIGATTHPVKTKSPNELGLYDMSGNVWEWCNDWHSSSYYLIGDVTDPIGPTLTEFEQVYANRLVRGGSWYSPGKSASCSVYHRHYYMPSTRQNDLGLRLALTASE